ncbi:MAG: hypothetical protein ACI8RZ_003615 [Myxococcota bacterium]|jgi:hypothetical protein
MHLGAGYDLGGTVVLRTDGVDLAQGAGAMSVYLDATVGELSIEEPELVDGEPLLIVGSSEVEVGKVHKEAH